MPTTKRQSTHYLFFPWAKLITTLCTSCLCINLSCPGSLLMPTQLRNSQMKLRHPRRTFSTQYWKFSVTLRGRTLSLTQCLTDYIDFCMENTVPTRTVRCFSSNKPCITQDIKALLKERKKRAIVLGNKKEQKMVQRELRRRISEGKNCYRRRMEDYLQQNNISGVWRGLRGTRVQHEGDQKWANDLNSICPYTAKTPSLTTFRSNPVPCPLPP